MSTVRLINFYPKSFLFFDNEIQHNIIQNKKNEKERKTLRAHIKYYFNETTHINASIEIQ